MGIDSANPVGIASNLVRICSPDVTSDERGLLPKQNGGNRGSTSSTPTHSGWLRDYRQDVNRIGNLASGGSFPGSTSAISEKYKRGILKLDEQLGVRVPLGTLKGNLYIKNTTPTEAA